MLFWFLVSLFLRRRFQFSLRSLLAFMLLLSVPLGWLAWKMQRAKRQREAVEGILKAGGRIGYDYEFVPRAPVWVRKSLGEDFFCDASCCGVRGVEGRKMG